MASEYKATFEVTNWDEKPFDEAEGTAKLTRASVTKSYSGDVEGTSATEWVMAYASDGSAIFVGVERVTGAVDGREGTFTLKHVGAFEGTAAKAELSVVEGAGSGDLAGVTGRGTFLADPDGSITLSVDLG